MNRLLLICVASAGLGGASPSYGEEVLPPPASASDSVELKLAINLYSVTQAARAAGYAGKWADVADLIKTMEEGIEMKYGEQTIHFKVAPLSEGERKAALAHIALKDDGSITWVK